ncbi:MAG: hypothetical protein WC899_15165 [bacterium]|jgi:hypothetical protein
MKDPVALLSGYLRIDPLPPREEAGKIHGVDERIPQAGIGEMTEIVYKLIEGWNG